MAEFEYVQMLEDSLLKKVDYLKQLKVLNIEQKRILEDNSTSPEEFEDNVNMKADIIERLESMDLGFDQLFNSIREELSTNRELYKDHILKMQELITDITDLSVCIEMQEKTNQEIAKNRFAFVRKQIKEVRKGNEAVTSYYKSMNSFPGMDSQFLDRKK